MSKSQQPVVTAWNVQQLLDNKAKKEEIVLEIEKLIRSYDPCFSCSSHFLKINWI